MSNIASKPPLLNFTQAVYLVGSGLITDGLRETADIGGARWVVLASGFSGLAVMTIAACVLVFQSSLAEHETGMLKIIITASDLPPVVALLERYGALSMLRERWWRRRRQVRSSNRAQHQCIADLPGGHEEAERAAGGAGDGVRRGVHAALGAADRALEILFFTHRLEAVRRLQIGCINHERRWFGTFSGQTFHYAKEDADIALSLPPIVKRLVRAMLPGRIAPAQPVAVDEFNPAQELPVVHARLALALGGRAQTSRGDRFDREQAARAIRVLQTMLEMI